MILISKHESNLVALSEMVRKIDDLKKVSVGKNTGASVDIIRNIDKIVFST